MLAPFEFARYMDDRPTTSKRKGDHKAKFLHWVPTACILRMQRLGYSPKNTCHLSSSTAKQQSPHENNETAFNLPTLNMSFFHKVQLGQTQNPCFLTPLQCFFQ